MAMRFKLRGLCGVGLMALLASGAELPAQDEAFVSYERFGAVGDGMVKDTKYFKIIDGQVVQMVDQKINWRFYPNPSEIAPVIESKTGNTVTYSVTFNVDNHTVPGPLEARTFIIKHDNNGARIIGGTFMEEAFYLESGNPQTSDAPLVAVCALALSAAVAAAVILKKKKTV